MTPISKTSRANRTFMDSRALFSTSQFRRWSMLKPDEKEFWSTEARKIIYPDLRTSYTFDHEMVYTMAVALYETYCYSRRGGSEPQDRAQDFFDKMSVFDSVDYPIKGKEAREANE